MANKRFDSAKHCRERLPLFCSWESSRTSQAFRGACLWLILPQMFIRCQIEILKLTAQRGIDSTDLSCTFRTFFVVKAMSPCWASRAGFVRLQTLKLSRRAIRANPILGSLPSPNGKHPSVQSLQSSSASLTSLTPNCSSSTPYFVSNVQDSRLIFYESSTIFCLGQHKLLANLTIVAGKAQEAGPYSKLMPIRPHP